MIIRAALAAAFGAVALAASAHADVAPYGSNDAGGFRNILPPGSAGVDNVVQFAQFEAGGARPAHWDDQLPLFTDLLYASPHLTHDDVATYFKDATFGVKPGDVERTENITDGTYRVTIVRDRGYGVPHIYGVTDDDVEFGAGYAAAEDRLFFIDVLRHTARSQLSSFIGGAASNRASDRSQWSIAPYTEADLQAQIDNAPRLYGAQGAELVAGLNAFVAGINEYIAEAGLDPTKMPAEYALFGKTPTKWKPTDVIAEASLIGGIFGKGGGNEVGSAEVLNALVERFGRKAGRRAWADFRSKNDPEAPTTILGRRFPYETTSSFAKRGLAIPDPGSVTDEPVGPALSRAAVAASRDSIGGQLLRQLRDDPLASNWELVSARKSVTGHPIGVLGSQVGYYVPEVLMEQDLHGPHIDARGASFPGVNLTVQLGHGRDYAWHATTATSDNIDTFAEVLCQDDHHYVYKGQCLPMEQLEVHNSWIPNVSDHTPAGSETLTAWRTVHGIVYARGTVKGKKVAFARARTTYFHEADSLIAFAELNDPGFLRDVASFRKAIDGINFLFNWSYIDSDHIAYQFSGWLPRKAKGVSPDFPVLGTGEYDWQGYDKDLHTEKTVPLNKRPHSLDQAYQVSWNNKQAPGFAAADDKFTFGPVYRSQMIEDHIKADLAGGRKMSIEQLVQAMEEPASEDLRGLKLVPILKRALGRISNPDEAAAFAKLVAWSRAGAHRRDLDKDGNDDDAAAIQIMDAWWPRLVRAEFGPAIGDEAMEALQRMVAFPNIGYDNPHSYPGFSDGWWGFVSKDLRGLFERPRVRGHWSRVYCGSGSKARCRRLLLDTLAEALKATPEELYAHGACASNPTSACWDMNRWTVASAITIPPFPFQNRPTFQQIIELTKRLPR